MHIGCITAVSSSMTFWWIESDWRGDRSAKRGKKRVKDILPANVLILMGQAYKCGASGKSESVDSSKTPKEI